MAQNEKKSDRNKQKEFNKSKQVNSKRKVFKMASPRCESPKKSLFGSQRFQSKHKKKQSFNGEGIASSNKVITTDESNNGYESKVHQSIFYCQNKEPNEQYFHSTAIKQNKKEYLDIKHHSKHGNKSKDKLDKFDLIKKIIVSHDREVARMKNVLSEKQLHRLIKMQSIQRMRMVQSIQETVPPKQKRKN